MSEQKDLFEASAESVETSAVSDQVEQAYIDYAMSVIGGRALPDVRDGLKPVQRRTLYKMYNLGVTSNSAHRKSSSIIGETMGDLHPHGDKAIYDSLVRMSQDFSLGVPLVDGQGNFGSMDGDPPAAMRYTEARMSEFAEDMLDDIEKETVNFSPNYDNRMEEPDVLPSALPNILINGASGIAVGMTTDIQPHNVGEVVDATIHRMNNPSCSVSDLMEFIKSPDFPTGATIVGRDGIKEAYESGKGRIRVRSDYEVNREKNRIIIREIPYQRKKSKIVEKIASNIEDGTIDEISDVRDESDRNGVRIVVDIKSSGNIDIVENKLIENVIEDTVTMNHIALVDGQPKKLSLDSIIDNYVEHRREVVKRRSEYELEEAEQRLHIVKGRLKALEDIENIVDSIRNSQSRDDAVKNLQVEYDFSEEQSEHITRMRLSSITGMQEEELKNEKSDLTSEIKKLTRILENPDVLDDKIIEELKEMKQKHNHERRTDIVEDYQSVDNEDLIPQEDVITVITENNYVKRMSAEEFEVQNRGGKGVYANYHDGDSISEIFLHSTHDELLFLTSKGDVHSLKGYQIPKSSRHAHGTNVVNIIDVDTDENIESVVNKDKNPDGYITITTERGKVKKTEMSEFDTVWNPGLKSIDLPEDDYIANAHSTNGDKDIMMVTNSGQVIRFDESDVRPTGRTSYGVMGIEMTDDDYVSDTAVVSEDTEETLTVTQLGNGKRSDISEYRQQSRNGKGMKSIGDTNSGVVSLETIDSDGSVFLTSKKGKLVRVDKSDISKFGRTASGVNIMELETGDLVSDAKFCCDD